MLRLTHERQKRGWTQTKLAHTSGTDQGLLSRIESSRFKPYRKQLNDLADALDFPGDQAASLLEHVESDEI